MPLIFGLLTFFAGATVLALIYQFAIRRRPAVTAIHYAVLFGLFVMLVVYLAAIVLDILDITPEPEELSSAGVAVVALATETARC